MPLNLLDNKLISILDLIVASAHDEVFVPTKHLDGGVECLHTIMLPLVSTALISRQRMAVLALDDRLAHSQLMGWK